MEDITKESKMGKIKIVSNKPAKVYIDEKALGEIKKETKEYELEKGKHEVYAKSAWCGSKKIKVDLEDDEVVTLNLNSFKYEDLIKGVFMLFVMLFMFTKVILFLAVAGVILLYPLYYITIGSSRYLDLELKK
ncbi:MAG: hypothetical protein CR982_06990 [Candidatus Cloacimonadota bacterium]|nr:MAG: hypothetical protein CR982_06990 [Candidatus Cloacimonadota bacterium]PIE80656.1 MAG: hypothetical protein CSA15_01775 [Candidatus Delongbacteria bacterium]